MYSKKSELMKAAVGDFRKAEYPGLLAMTVNID